MANQIQVFSEIGRLRKVLVHRPGKEVERLYPEVFGPLLFDDVMDLNIAQAEHDDFTKKLRQEGVEVFYIEKLVAEVLDKDASLREVLVSQFLQQAEISDPSLIEAISQFWLKNKSNLELVKAMIAGVKKTEIQADFAASLAAQFLKNDPYPFYVDPIPNLLFQRDTLACVYQAVNINKMWAKTRRREAIFYYYLREYHPDWRDIPLLFDSKTDEGHIEGGDILVISPETLLVGVSQRTNGAGLESFARKVFGRFEKTQQIIGITIPKERASMHLDTVLTQMDHDKFSIDADMAQLEYQIYELTPAKAGLIKIKIANMKIKSLLEKYLKRPIKFVIVGGGDPIRAKREQWNDGANCLTIRPGVVMTYARNWVTNAEMEKVGVKVIRVGSSELSRGRGGPRCMSMPLWRDLIERPKQKAAKKEGKNG
ncbi:MULTISPECIES: arginine deiminase [unclassified Mycoplasma]|uniref:arginine deiminase n=1 Tax=unclassified Mycoplasma TaxID=2683645 RepID=UPI000FDEC02C